MASAGRRFADVYLPQGAQALSTPPKGSGDWLQKPVERPLTPNCVDDRGFYVVKGAAPGVMKWFESHAPKGSTLSGTGVVSSRGTPELWSAEFSWPAVHNVLFSEEVVMGVVRLPGNRAAVRVDSQVTWLPGRSPLDTVPAGAEKVTVIVAEPNGEGGPGQRLEPTISTDQLVLIAKITKDVNDLQVLLPGPHPCPPGPDLEIYVSFLPAPKAAPEATTKAYPYGCAFVRQHVGSLTSPQFLVDGGVLASQLEHLVGLKLPPVPPGVHGG